MKKSIFCLNPHSLSVIYGEPGVAAVRARTDLVADPIDSATVKGEPDSRWTGVEVIFSGWGMSVVDAKFLESFPKLEAIFYGAGSIRGFSRPEMWERGVRVFSAAAANAIPVAEFTVAAIIMGLKQALPTYRRQDVWKMPTLAGAFESRVGLLSLGEIGRLVAARLQTYDLEVVAFDPFFDPARAEKMGVKLVSLDEVFATSAVVSCHTPWLPSTVHMLGRSLFSSMPEGAVFINTARGAVVNEPEMIAVLEQRPDLHVILDVTYPEPPVEGSPLYRLPNVFLTPHIAGSIGPECRRMGRLMIEEFDRWAGGSAPRHEVTREMLELMA